MVHKLVYGVPSLPDLVNTIDIDLLQQLINLFTVRNFLDKNSQEINHLWIVVVNAEVKTVEQSHGILLNVARVLTDAVYNFQVQRLFPLTGFLCKSIGFFEPISYFMVKIDFFSENFNIVILDLLLRILAFATLVTLFMILLLTTLRLIIVHHN